MLGPTVDLESKTWKKKHRTCVIIEVGETSSPNFKERVRRLTQTLSLSGSMCVDAFRSANGMLELYSEAHTGLPGRNPDQTEGDYSHFAVAKGYDCMIIVREPMLPPGDYAEEILKILAEEQP